MRIWNVERSAADIAAGYLTPVNDGSSGLVAYWKSDEGTGTLANDNDDAGANDATLVNGTAWIARAHAEDCDADGIPDDCEIQIGDATACNTNDALDACEATTGDTGFPTTLSGNTTGFAATIFLGAPDDTYHALGGQLITYDFGDSPVIDGARQDFNIYEVDFGTAEFNLIDVQVSNDGVSFTSVKSSEAAVVSIPGDETHSDGAYAMSYDLSVAGLTQARYVRINGDGTGDAFTGFDLDAIGAIHINGIDCNTNLLPDPCDGPDCNTNNLLDECELATFDCNANGTVDACDAAAGAPDCDEDDVLDICELAGGAPDCNTNNVPDGCDADCDTNGAPDVCDLAGGAVDCNTNEALDECDTAGGAEDCNGNLVPDECDFASGAPDCDSNGIIDECGVAWQSQALSPFDSDHQQTFTIVSPPLATTDVVMTFTAYADLDTPSERIDVDVNGVPVGAVFGPAGEQCQVATEQLIIPADVFNSAVAGGDAAIHMVGRAPMWATFARIRTFGFTSGGRAIAMPMTCPTSAKSQSPTATRTDNPMNVTSRIATRTTWRTNAISRTAPLIATRTGRPPARRTATPTVRLMHAISGGRNPACWRR